MQIEIVSVHRNRFILELDDDLDPFALAPRREVQQRVFVQPQLRKHALQANLGGTWHRRILIHCHSGNEPFERRVVPLPSIVAG